MFGVKKANKVINGNENIQVSGNVENLEIGIPFKQHYDIIKQRVDEVSCQHEELRILSERALVAEKEILQRDLKDAAEELNTLNSILRDPQKYLDFAHGAQIKFEEFFSHLRTQDFSSRLGSIKGAIASGAYSVAEVLVEEVEQETELSSAMESEIVSVRATLSCLSLEFQKAETLFRRAFYLSPSVSGLVSLIDQMDMNGKKQGLLLEFSSGEAVIGFEKGSDTSVQLLATEAVLRGAAGELAQAKALLNRANAEIKENRDYKKDSKFSVAVAAASVAAVEENQMAAMKSFQRALSLLEEDKDENSLYVLRVQANVAACLAEMNRLPAAIEATRKCITGLRKLGPPAEYHLGIRLNNLGDFLVRNKQPQEAISILNESIEIAEKILPRSHPSFIRRRLNLALAHKSVGDAKTAVKILKSIEMDESMWDEMDKRSFVKAMYQLFIWSYQAKNWFDALTAMIQIQKIGQKYLRNIVKEKAVPIMIAELQTRIISSSIDVGQPNGQ